MIFNPIIVNKADSETVVTDLDMSNGDQIIEPLKEVYLIDKVIVKKPESMKQENIRSGVTIGGVTGTYETETEPLSVTTNGEYFPPEGKCFSKVMVNVEAAGSDGEEYSLLTSFYYGYYNKFVTLGGYYTVDGGAATYFESGTDLLITGLSKGSAVDIYLPVEQYVAEEDGFQLYLWEVDASKASNCDVAVDDSNAEVYSGFYRITLSKFTGSVTAFFGVDFE